MLQKFPCIGGWQVVAVPPGAGILDSLAAYRKSGLVQCAEPDYVRGLALAPNDPKYVDGTLWALNNTGQNGGTMDADIDAPEAWDLLTSASNIVVAVLDTGIRPSHEDLSINIWTNPVLGGFGWNQLATNTSPDDDEGHGSLVSGILGAAGNNGKGVVGVAWRVQIMACKCFNSSRLGYDSDIIACIDFARTNGARIINASLGSYSFSQALYDAVDSARQAGIIFVASTGNDSRDIDAVPYYPACFDLDNIVSVAFTTRNDLLDSHSNFGATNVDLAAPGASMYSTFFTADNSYLGGSYLFGSSLAAPYVTGTFALLLARYPGESYSQTIDRVLTQVDRIPSLAGECVTGGRLNLRKALSPPILISVVPQVSGGEFRCTISAGPDRTCVVEASNDLQAWSPVFTNTTSSSGSFGFTNSAANAGAKFYRVFSSP